jgi:pyruvate kinase
MVTMPSEAAYDQALIRDLLTSGMDIMRINCAHDNPDAWLAMIKNLRHAEHETGRPCKIYADLAGPKLRTGQLEPAGRIVKCGPKRMIDGTISAPARICLVSEQSPQVNNLSADIQIPLSEDILSVARKNDVLTFRDARGKERSMEIVKCSGGCRMAELKQTAYIDAGSTVLLYHRGKLKSQGHFGNLPEVFHPIHLFEGDILILTRVQEPGRPANRDSKGKVIKPARISCSPEEVFEIVKPHERIYFDDGKIGGTILENDRETITVRITHTGPKGGKLKSEKGINLPDSFLNIPALTTSDFENSKLLARHVDMIGLSFIRTPEDIARFEEHLHSIRAAHLGIVLKVENRQAFEKLPRMLLTSLRSPPVGVMVARGDLAVEVGFERLAEVQEEILWLCEAAHIPVIWATQVLEGLATRGAPSRAEISDAVMSGRAECVMLNKGKYVKKAVVLLSRLLERMEAHQSKKRSMLRKLSVSSGY